MDNVNIESGEPNKSVREALMNYAAKMMNGLVQHDRFGPFLIPLNPNTNLKGAVHLNTPPPWCNENDIRTLISDLTPLEKQSLESFRKISRSDNKKFHLMIFASDAIVCKIIVLIRALHFCWAYYDPDTPQIQTVEAKPSELFNAHITPDIKLVFDAIVQFVLPCPIDLAGNKAIRLDNINKAMYLLLDFLAGWIPGKEVDDLRSTYAELIDRCSPALYEKILRCLDAVGTRFASEEPKWELERNKPTKKQKTQRRGRKGSGNKGPRTEKMAEQFSNLCHYMDNLGKNDRRSPRAKVFSFWQKNKERFERDAKMQGDNRGYPSAEHLYIAYHSKMSRRN